MLSFQSNVIAANELSFKKVVASIQSADYEKGLGILKKLQKLEPKETNLKNYFSGVPME